MVANDTMYHSHCLSTLYNRYRKETQKSNAEDAPMSFESIVLAELVSYIEENKEQATFLLSDLTKLYAKRLKELGACVPERVNSTRLKERLLSVIPGLKAINDGKEVRLTYDWNINAALHLAETHDFDEEALLLAKTALIIRKDLLKKQKQFDGSFDVKCQEQAVPPSLLALVNMILAGPSIQKSNSEESTTGQSKSSNAALAISQLLIFNAINRKREVTNNEAAIRHTVEREAPLPLYVGLVIHAETRKKKLVDKFYRMGLSVSYDRVMQVSTDLGNDVCALYEEEGVVCPPKLKKSIFTTGNVDNIDHDTSSRTAKSSFHGTAITLTQHPSEHTDGIERRQVKIHTGATKAKVISPLPESYTNMENVTLSTGKDLFVPKTGVVSKPKANVVDASIRSEHTWLCRVKELLDKEKREEKEYLSWSAHFASIQEHPPRAQAITGLLPLFCESAHTATTIQHSMKVIKEAISYVNPGQTPIIAMDQPLYAIAKQIQWKEANIYGEDKFIVMMGGLHIEMATLKLIGHWLKGSGWDSALVQADVTTRGRAEAILKASHITRSRYAHQISACALHILQKRAHEQYVQSPTSNENLDFSSWVSNQKQQHPQFLYWATVLELELLMLELVKSIREGKFLLYIQVLGKLVPWMFVLDLTNYSRWLPVHIRYSFDTFTILLIKKELL